MPIDPILANPKQFKMPDPMEQMGGFLTNALAMDKLQAGRQERADNAMLNEVYKATGGDRDKMRNELITRGQGRHLPGVEKGWWEADEAKAKVGKTTAETAGTKATTLKSKLESFRTTLAPFVNNPNVTAQDMYGVMTAAFNDPDIGEWYGQMGVTPEVMKQGIDQAAQQGQLSTMARVLGMGAQQALEQNHQVISEENKQTLVGVNKYGAPGTQVAGTYGPKPKAAGTTVNVNTGGDDYAKKLATLQAEDDFKKGKKAEAAPLILNDIQRGLSLVDRAYTGYFSEGQGNITSLAKGLGANVNDDALQATQELKMILSGDMLKNIGTLRNEYDVKLGSVTEKEFAQLQNTVPKITDDPATIKAWLTRLDAATRTAQQEYQQRLNSISTSPVTGPAVRGMSVPPPPQLPSSGQPPGPPPVPGAIRPAPPAAVEYLRKNPGTAAQFDRKYGQGAAARALGGTSTGGSPFPAGGR